MTYSLEEQSRGNHHFHQSVPVGIHLAINILLYIASVIEYRKVKQAVKETRTDTPINFAG